SFGNDLLPLFEPAHDFVLAILFIPYRDRALGELAGLHLYINERFVLRIGQHRRYGRREDVASRFRVNRHVDEHILLKQPAGVPRHNSYRRSARRRVERGADVLDLAMENLADGWIRFVNFVADADREQIPVENMALHPYRRDI